MDDEETQDDTGYGSIDGVGQSPLALISSMSSSYASTEGRKLAREAYDKLQTERDALMGEQDDAADEQAQAAEEAKNSLKAARDRLSSRKADQAEKWLALAEGLGSPTSSGSFGETLGNVARGQREVNKSRRAFEDDQSDGLLKFDQAIIGVDGTLARARADLAKARMTSNTALMKEAMNTIAKEERKNAMSGVKPGSKNGKIALDEGKEPGTPAYVARVKELNAIDIRNAAATAGTDAPVLDPAQQETAILDSAHELGVPIAPNPYAQLSTKERKTALDTERKNTDSTLKSLEATEQDARAGIVDMNNFMHFNKRQDSGKAAGIFPAWGEDAQTMDAITARVSRKMKQPGEGSTSDFDAKQFVKGTVGRDKKYQANRVIASAYIIMRENEINRIAFLRDYAQVNGHMKGADAAWSRYLNANSIFDPHDPEHFKLNRQRKDYKTYFREQLGDKPAVGTDPGAADMQGGEQVDDPTADDNDPGHFQGEDNPAISRADGGRVGTAARLVYQVSCKGKPIGSAFSTRAKAIGLRERMAEKHPDQMFNIDPKPADAVQTQVRGPAYAEGGPVLAADGAFDWDDDPDSGEGESEAEDDGSSGLRDALYAALQGGTLGTADEIQGTVDPEGAAANRSNHSDYASKDPLSENLAFAAGMSPLAALVPGGGLLRTALTGAGVGAAVGAAGADGDRGGEALNRGAAGAVTAPLASLAAKYIYNRVGQLVDRMTGKPLSAAEEKVVKAAMRDGVDLNQVSADIRTAERNAVPLGVEDVSGRRTQALIEKAATRGGAESEQFLDDRTGKNANAAGRIEDQINKGLAPSEYFGEFEKLNKELYNNSKPLYDAAYKKYPGIKSKEFMRLMDTKDGKRAFNEAMRLMELDGKPIGKTDALGLVKKPSLEFLDYYKRGLDQLIATEEATKPTTLGHSLRSARNKFRDELDTAAPEYADARKQYAGDLEVRDALKEGREDFSRMTPQEVTNKVQAMSFAEKDAFRSGVSQKLFETLGSPTTDANSARRILGSDNTRAKLKATFDDPKKWKIFEASLDQEMGMFDRNKKLTARVEGKKTQALAKEDNLLGNVMDGGMQSTPGMGGISWPSRVYNWLRFPMPMSEKQADEVLKVINRGDKKAFESTMQRLSQAQSRLKIRGKRASKVGAMAAVLAAGAWAPSPPGEGASTEEEDR